MFLKEKSFWVVRGGSEVSCIYKIFDPLDPNHQKEEYIESEAW